MFKNFVKKWSAHRHAKPTENCNKILVLDGNWKVSRLKCTYDNLWYKTAEFGECRVGCTNTPERFSYYCKEHSSYELEFDVDGEKLRVKPKDILVSKLSNISQFIVIFY